MLETICEIVNNTQLTHLDILWLDIFSFDILANLPPTTTIPSLYRRNPQKYLSPLREMPRSNIIPLVFHL